MTTKIPSLPCGRCRILPGTHTSGAASAEQDKAEATLQGSTSCQSILPANTMSYTGEIFLLEQE